MAQNKALLIGVGSYEPSTGWKSIGSCNDVDILKQSLPTSFHISTLTNEKATYKNIVTAIIIPVFAPSLTLNTVPMKVPRESPAKLPINAKLIICAK